MTPAHHGTIKNGKLMFDDRALFLNHLNGLEGKRVVVTVQREKNRRTLKQNAWYWAVAVKMIAEHTGHEPEEVHEALKGAFCPKVLIGNLVAPKSTRTLDTIDFGDNMMEKVVRWAAEELQLVIPMPEDVEI